MDKYLTMNKLKQELKNLYLRGGITKEVLNLSMKLDELIVEEQKKRLLEIRKNK